MLDEAKLHEDIGAIKASVANIEAALAAGSGKFTKHDERIRRLEIGMGAVMAAGGVAMCVLAFLEKIKAVLTP